MSDKDITQLLIQYSPLHQNTSFWTRDLKPTQIDSVFHRIWKTLKDGESKSAQQNSRRYEASQEVYRGTINPKPREQIPSSRTNLSNAARPEKNAHHHLATSNKPKTPCYTCGGITGIEIAWREAITKIISHRSIRSKRETWRPHQALAAKIFNKGLHPRAIPYVNSIQP